MPKFLILSIFSSAMLSGFMIPVKADITVRLPEYSQIEMLEVEHYPISAIATANSFKEMGVVEETIPVKNRIAQIKVDNRDNYIYHISSGQDLNEVVFIGKDDDLLVEITSINPYTSAVSGSEIMNGITAIKQSMQGLQKEMQLLRGLGESIPQEKVDSIRNEVYTIFTAFIEKNMASPVAAYAVSKLDNERFEYYSSRLSDEAKFSMLYPLVEGRLKYIAAEKEKERKMQQLQSGTMTAPVFSLEDLNGESVSLTEFRGKWIILDFWGSWCIWCIKGFPELKETYQKYTEQLEIIGIDCRESKEAWRTAVIEYELPWVNLYCPDGCSILREYGIDVFPTKIIIDPEGKIRNVTVGHNTEFFDILEALVVE